MEVGITLSLIIPQMCKQSINILLNCQGIGKYSRYRRTGGPSDFFIFGDKILKNFQSFAADMVFHAFRIYFSDIIGNTDAF